MFPHNVGRGASTLLVGIVMNRLLIIWLLVMFTLPL